MHSNTLQQCNYHINSLKDCGQQIQQAHKNLNKSQTVHNEWNCTTDGKL